MAAHVPIVSAAPIDALREQYDTVMSRNKAPLFSTFDNYLASLPVRRSNKLGDYVKLAELPFFAREEDMKLMVARLEGEKGGNIQARSLVRYACGQSGAGKTSSICPAFLYSAKSESSNRFSHYLYLAFENNKTNRFEARGLKNISEEKKTAEAQGAGFMLDCLASQFNRTKENNLHPVVIKVKTEREIGSERSVESFAEDCETLLNGIMAEGRILVHVDEHRKMAEDDRLDKGQFRHFRRGAMTMLALVARVEVIATFIEPPSEISAENSSGTCRHPVPVPTLDIEAAMRAAGVRLDAQEEKFNRSDARMVASLKFRLGAKLTREMLNFHLTYNCPRLFEKVAQEPEIQELRSVNEAFSNYIDKTNKGTLREVSRLVEKPFASRTVETDDDVLEMFIGMSEGTIDQIGKKVAGQMVAISDSESSVKMHYSIAEILHRVPTPGMWYHGVWFSCSELFKQALDKNSDICSGTPLERALLWGLAATSTKTGVLKLTERRSVRFECKSVEKARIFPETSVVLDQRVLDNIARLKPYTLYYADEHENRKGVKGVGETSHPIGDIFFRTQKGELVLIDATVNPYQRTRLKRQHMQSLAELWKANRDPPIGDLLMLICNPLETAESRASETCAELEYVFGQDAKGLLGGLAQCIAWY